jgi:hypothetical protein
MSKIERRYWYMVRKELLDSLEVFHVMDLLRYDWARVEPNAPEGFYLLSKLQTGGYAEPAAAHWQSFGIQIYLIGVFPHQPPRDECLRISKAWDLMRSKV